MRKSDKQVGAADPIILKRRRILQSKDIVNKLLITDLVDKIEAEIENYVTQNSDGVDLQKQSHKHNLAETIFKKITTGADEIPRNVAVLKAVEERLDVGQKRYGQDIPIDDGRDWLQESIEEVLDTIVYLTNYLLTLKEKRDG